MSQTQNIESGHTLQNNGIIPPLSVYIPRMFNNISADRITQVFQDLQLGRVHHVDFVPRIDSNETKMAFVHFEYWNTHNVACEHLIERINDPEREARVVYEDPYYWILLPNHNNSASIVYNSYNMRRDINRLSNNVENLQREFYNINNVLDTLLSDFYDIPQRGNETREDEGLAVTSSNFERLRQEQNEKRVCPVCSLTLFSDATQCPACETPINADKKLLKVLTAKPDDTSPEGIETARTNALNKINDFVESEHEEPETQYNNTESQRQSWASSWFGN